MPTPVPAAVLEGNTAIDTAGHLEGRDQSALRDGQRIAAHRIWRGSPAQECGVFDPASLPPRPEISETRRAREGLFFVCGVFLTATIFFLPIFPSFMLVDWMDDLIPLSETGRYSFATHRVLHPRLPRHRRAHRLHRAGFCRPALEKRRRVSTPAAGRYIAASTACAGW